MELLVYALICSAAAVASVFSWRIESLKFGAIFFCLSIIHSVVIRLSGFESDILSYASAMRLTGVPSRYYTDEPVVWLGQRYLYSIVANEAIVFVIYDMMISALVYIGFRSLGAPAYSLLAFMAFFPVILGFQNIYRQLLAEAALIATLGLWGSGRRSGVLTGLIAAGSHTSSLLFLPAVALLSKSLIMRWAGVAAFVVALMFLQSASTGFVTRQTGADFGRAYLLVLLVGFLVYVVIDRRNLLLDKKFFYLYSYLVVLACAALLFIGGLASERISMFCLCLLYPFACTYIQNRIPGRNITGVIITLGGFLPILFFGPATFIVERPLLS